MLGALKEKMVTPDLVEDFIRTFEEEVSKAGQERVKREQRTRDRLGEIERSIKRIIRVIEDGGYVRSMTDQLRALEAEQDAYSDEAGHAFRNEAGHRSDLKPATCASFG